MEKYIIVKRSTHIGTEPFENIESNDLTQALEAAARLARREPPAHPLVCFEVRKVTEGGEKSVGTVRRQIRGTGDRQLRMTWIEWFFPGTHSLSSKVFYRDFLKDDPEDQNDLVEWKHPVLVELDEGEEE